MATVHLHVGQCGVQVGQALWSAAARLAQEDDDVRHVMWTPGKRGTGDPRALFIDAERKVVRKFEADAKRSKPPIDVGNSAIHAQTGSGSNFAFGRNRLAVHRIGADLPRFDAGFGRFTAVDRDSAFLDVVTEAARMKVEACDSFSGFVAVASAGGGTGAGFGSRLCEELADLYPTAYRLWNVVLAHRDGESPTQHYNQLLTLAALQRSADAVVCFDNDQLLADSCCASTRNDPITTAHVNRAIADTMMSVYLPVSSLTPTGGGGISIGMEPWELIRSVAPSPKLKLLQMRRVVGGWTASQQQPDWNKLTRQLATRAKCDTWHNDVIMTSLGAVCVCRDFDASVLTRSISDRLQAAYDFVVWNPHPVDMWIDQPARRSSARMRRGRRINDSSVRATASMTTCTNTSAVSRTHLTRLVRKSRAMYESGAYLHWYRRYGVDRPYFEDAFDVVASVIDDYEEAVRR